MKKILALTLSLMLVAALLAGCGRKSESLAGNSAAPESAYDKGLGNGYVTEDSASTENSPEKPELVTSQKLVRKVWITAETDDLDALLQQVDQKFSALGGYAEKREVHNGSPTATRRYRRASLTIRVPAEQLNSFTGELAGMSNITSSTESADDITLSYVATQSRITALETEQTRLLELLAVMPEGVASPGSSFENLYSYICGVTSEFKQLDRLNSAVEQLYTVRNQLRMLLGE